jgi:hypothetical protein
MPVTINMVDRVDEVPDRTDEFARFLAPLAYQLVYQDGLNAFFLAEEHRELARHFSRPPGIFDHIVHAASIRPCEEEIAKLRAELAALKLKRRESGGKPAQRRKTKPTKRTRSK